MDVGARAFLQKELALEYDLYDFAVRRLHEQASACDIDLGQGGRRWQSPMRSTNSKSRSLSGEAAGSSLLRMISSYLVRVRGRRRPREQP